MVFILCLTYFTQHGNPNGIISFFLRAKQYSIVYMYHIFFVCVRVCVYTHSPSLFFLKPYLYPSIFDGHLGRFHILAIVNNAAMKRRVACIFSN